MLKYIFAIVFGLLVILGSGISGIYFFRAKRIYAPHTELTRLDITPTPRAVVKTGSGLPYDLSTDAWQKPPTAITQSAGAYSDLPTSLQELLGERSPEGIVVVKLGFARGGGYRTEQFFTSTLESMAVGWENRVKNKYVLAKVINPDGIVFNIQLTTGYYVLVTLNSVNGGTQEIVTYAPVQLNRD